MAFIELLDDRYERWTPLRSECKISRRARRKARRRLLVVDNTRRDFRNGPYERDALEMSRYVSLISEKARGPCLVVTARHNKAETSKQHGVFAGRQICRITNKGRSLIPADPVAKSSWSGWSTLMGRSKAVHRLLHRCMVFVKSEHRCSRQRGASLQPCIY